MGTHQNTIELSEQPCAKVKPPDPWYDTRKFIAVWVVNNDYDLLKQIAVKHKLNLSELLRAIITDAIADETQTT